MSAPATANLFAALDTKKKKKSKVRLRFLPTPKRPLAAGGARARRSRAGPALSRTVPARASKNTKGRGSSVSPRIPSLLPFPSPVPRRRTRRTRRRTRRRKRRARICWTRSSGRLPRPDATSPRGRIATRMTTTTSAPPADSASSPKIGRTRLRRRTTSRRSPKTSRITRRMMTW